MDGMGFGRYRLASAIEVRLIIRSPGLAYALNDFLEVLSHLQREYEETRTTKKTKSKKNQDGHKKYMQIHKSVNGFVDGSCGGFLKCWYPQIIHFYRVFHYKPSILGYHIFWKTSIWLLTT